MFFATSTSCTTTELSIILISCLAAIKIMLYNNVQQFMEVMLIIYFGLLKIQVQFLIN